MNKEKLFNACSRKYKRASILIIALWSVCLLTTLAVILGYEVRQKIILVKRLDERDKTHFIAEAAVKKAIVELNKETEKNYDALNDNWSNNSFAFKEVNVGDGEFTISYDFNPDEEPDSTETRYGMIDEEGKININKSDFGVLERFFRLFGLGESEAQDLAYSIIDWRDADSQLSMPLGSAEDYYYRNLSHPYEAKDGDFEVLEEILLVKGMTHDFFQKIKDYITVYGKGKININTASKNVILALGVSADLADKIVSFRSGKDTIAGTSDDNIFQIPSDMVTELSEFYRLSDPELLQLNSISEKITTKSENFMIRATAGLKKGKFTASVSCVISRGGKILYWSES
jgi:general secretion pathway protein K